MSALIPASRVPEPSLSVQLVPSAWLWRYQCALHLVIVLLVAWVLWPWGWEARLLALLVVLGLAGHLAYRARCRSKESGCLSFSQGVWSWQTAEVDGSLVPVKDFVVWPWLMILSFRIKGNGERLTLVLLPDSAAADDLRRLRVLLLSHVWRRS